MFIAPYMSLQVAAEILRYLRVCAEEHINSRRREQRLGPVSVRRAVIGVPATCSERQRTATRVAARLAGFTEVMSCILAVGPPPL